MKGQRLHRGEDLLGRCSRYSTSRVNCNSCTYIANCILPCGCNATRPRSAQCPVFSGSAFGGGTVDAVPYLLWGKNSREGFGLDYDAARAW